MLKPPVRLTLEASKKLNRAKSDKKIPKRFLNAEYSILMFE